MKLSRKPPWKPSCSSAIVDSQPNCYRWICLNKCPECVYYSNSCLFSIRSKFTDVTGNIRLVCLIRMNTLTILSLFSMHSSIKRTCPWLEELADQAFSCIVHLRLTLISFISLVIESKSLTSMCWLGHFSQVKGFSLHLIIFKHKVKPCTWTRFSWPLTPDETDLVCAGFWTWSLFLQLHPQSWKCWEVATLVQRKAKALCTGSPFSISGRLAVGQGLGQSSDINLPASRGGVVCLDMQSEMSIASTLRTSCEIECISC